MPAGRWERVAPLAGALGVICVLLAFIVLGGSTPDEKDPGSKVLAFYREHKNRQEAAAFVLALGGVFFALFAAQLRSYLKRPPSTGRAATTAFVGAVLAAMGFLVGAGVHLALARSSKYGDETLARTLNVLDYNVWIPF